MSKVLSRAHLDELDLRFKQPVLMCVAVMHWL